MNARLSTQINSGASSGYAPLGAVAEAGRHGRPRPKLGLEPFFYEGGVARGTTRTGAQNIPRSHRNTFYRCAFFLTAANGRSTPQWM